MNTIMIHKDGRCHEFGVDHGHADPFIIGLDLRRKTALIHLKSRTGWAGRGTTKKYPAELMLVGFESFDIGERISGGDKKVFLRGVKLLGEFPTTRATAKTATLPTIQSLVAG